MIISKSTLLIGLILTLLSDPILCKRGSSHSYPKSSGGLSGGGHRSGGLSGGGSGYPSSGGHLSGGSSGGSHAYPSPGSSGGSHAYPSPGSSGGSHAYPSPGSSGGSHAYPSSGSSGGSHAYPSSGKSHGYPNSGGGLSGGGASYPSGSSGGSHTYPSSSGKNQGYPSSGGGLSGSGHSSSSNNKITHKTTVHHHYHYSPPAQISYAPHYGGVPVNYPVYRGTPPTYVYQYKDSGSKYGTLLAGLALMNLGTTAYVATHSHGGHSNYKQQPGEVCKFAIKKENGDYEETRIDCQIISGFIVQYEMETQKQSNNSTITTVTNVTVVNTTNVGAYQPGPVAPVPGNVLYNMLPNGTLVPVTSSVVTTTTTNTTLVSALDVKGKAVEVTPGMQCFVIRHSSMSNMRKTVPCGLLQTYADKSLKRNSATKHLPMFTFAAAVLAYCVPYLVT